MKKPDRKSLDNAMKGILNAGPVSAAPLPSRNKKNMNRKFQMELDRKSRPVMYEGGGSRLV